MKKTANPELKDLELKDGKETQPRGGYGLPGTALDDPGGIRLSPMGASGCQL